ncbi:MAG: tRNA preQ1(34) S-adenosylmethionine ribosyltransferase-isomerase QueA [Spirochaetaceae bacterium]|jgi:S-adenosylmethionine:tRNA ribosyltransferase-isomerase|nr:tRNA preQ1(34) S-adenosylmethionine ribosyltransferase-isomerase QueA [Spirochaetaceae bacterium]
MKLQDFTFDLPENLIAQYPPAERGASRLMLLDRQSGETSDRMVSELPAILKALFPKPPLLVFNNSRVRKARIYGLDEAGAKIEFLLLESRDGGSTWECLFQKKRRHKEGGRFVFMDGHLSKPLPQPLPQGEGSMSQGEGHFDKLNDRWLSLSKPLTATIHFHEGNRYLQFDQPIDEAWLEKNGHIPLPPYIKRPDENEDAERYQTVYARELGSAAAPTAGLHFTEGLLNELRQNGIDTAFITLHVGLGTFLPVREENIEEHKMHREFYHIDEATARLINDAKYSGRPVVTVGTTSMRCTESAWDDAAQCIRAGDSSTDIFIYPGYHFKVADALFTNFHTPGSTLLMLVSAFCQAKGAKQTGPEMILGAYKEAVAKKYRFFSYGDAMLIY